MSTEPNNTIIKEFINIDKLSFARWHCHPDDSDHRTDPIHSQNLLLLYRNWHRQAGLDYTNV